MRPRHHLVGTKVALLLIFGIVGGVLFARGGLTGEAVLSPVPSYHVDIGSSDAPSSTGNTYIEDPGPPVNPFPIDFNADNQLMFVPLPLTSCVRRTVTDFNDASQIRIVTDIIIQNADEMLGADVRINFDPSMIQFVSRSATPFTAGGSWESPIFSTGFTGTSSTGKDVGLVNLPLSSYGGGAHAPFNEPVNADNTDGAVFLGSTWTGPRSFQKASESGPTVDGGVSSLVDRNAGHAPNGGVAFRIEWDLQPASKGQDVFIDLTRAGDAFLGPSGTGVSVGSRFVTLTKEDPSFLQDTIVLGAVDLFDGVVSVNKLAPDPCLSHDVEAKGIGGLRVLDDTDLKLFKNCIRKGDDPCTANQNHHLKVVNNGTHTEDIELKYTLSGLPATCTVNSTAGGGAIDLLPPDTVESGVTPNSTQQTTATLNFSCPLSVAEGLVGGSVTFRLEAVHQYTGSNDGEPDDDASNDIITRAKKIK